MRYHYKLTKMPKFKTLTTADADEDVTTGTPIAGEKQNGTATLEDSLAVFYKTKKTLTVQSRNHGPWFPPKVENSCT